MKKNWLISLICLFFLITSCQKEEQLSPQLEEEKTNFQLPEGENRLLEGDYDRVKPEKLKLGSKVKIMGEAETQQMISYSDNEIVFMPHESLDEIEVGDILNSGPSRLAEEGFNKKVLDSKLEEGKLILEVETVSLDEVFEVAKFSHNMERSPKDEEGAIEKGYWSKDLGFTYRQEQIWGALNVRLDFKGTIRLGLQYDKNGWGNSDNFLKIRSEVIFPRDASAPDFTLKLGNKKDFTFAELPAGNWGFFIGPVWVYFKNSIKASFGIRSFVNIGLEASADLHGSAGFTFERQGWNTSTRRFHRWNNLQLDYQQPKFSSRAYGSIKFKFPIEFGSKLYGAKAFKFYGQYARNIEFKSNPNGKCFLTLEGFKELRAGVKGEFLGISNYDAFASWTWGRNILGEWFCNSGASAPGLNSGRRNKAMKSYHNRYISSENGGTATANRPAVGDWEKVEFLYNSNDRTYSIKGNNGKYLDVAQSSGGILRFDQPSRYQADAKFYVVDLGGGQYSIQSQSTGKYVSAEPSGRLIANRDRVGAWEKFRIETHNTAAAPANWKTILSANQFLGINQVKWSNNRQHKLVYQGDGNLVVYSNGSPVWASNTPGKTPWRTYMQGDGNFVVYSPNWKPVWNSGTYGNNGAYLQISDQGKLRIVNNGRVLWST